jgi:HAE1 family hydrophobic/amphiphilic exporter-1
MNLTRLSVKHPVAALMIVSALCLLGGVAYTQLAVKRLPDVEYPRVSVSVSYPGQLAENVRTEVLDPIENALSTIGGIDNMSSSAGNGRGRIVIRFDSGLDIDKKAAEVAHAVDAISGLLPAEVETPSVVKADPDAAPILSVAVSGPEDRAELYNLVTQTLQPALARVPGVATVTVAGGRQPQVRIDADPLKLGLYGVTLPDIVQALGGENRSIPGGTVEQSGREFAVQTVSRLKNLNDFLKVPVMQSPDKVVTLGQVADVSFGYAPVETHSEWNGKPAMSLSVTVQSNANPLQVSDGVRRTLDQLRPELPQNLEIQILGDLTVFTRRALSAVQADLFIALLAAGLVLALFLKRLRQTLIVMLAIPTSLLLTGLVMYALHYSIDLISLLAISLLIGILIDDAIVVLENIDRHRRMNKSAEEAAIDGRMEIGWAAAAITLTDIVVYTPVAFLSGNVGQLFREFGITIACASLFSLAVSFTLTPLLAAHWLKPSRRSCDAASAAALPPDRDRPATGRALAAYTRVQQAFVRHVYAAPAILLASGWFIYAAIVQGWVPTTFTPDENDGVLSVQVTLPVGTAEEVTRQSVSRFSDGIRSLPGIAGVLSTTGFGQGSVTGSNVGRIVVDLQSGSGYGSTARTIDQINTLAKTLPGAKIKISTNNPLLTESGGTLHLILRGTDLAVLNRLAQTMADAMRKIPGVSNVDSSVQASTPQWSIVQNPQAAALYGLTSKQIGQAVHLAVEGGTAGQFAPPGSLGGEPVVVQLKGGSNLTLEQMAQIPVGRLSGRTVTLGQVSRIGRTAAPEKIEEDDRQLQVSITANVSDSELGSAARALQETIRKTGLPAGVSFKLAGAAEQKNKTFGPLLKALGLSVLLIYMLLAALYESFLDPLAVIAMLPFAASGGLLALWITGTPFSLYAFIAMIMLMGLVAKNAILLVDYARHNLKRGMSPQVALLAAGQVRLRPVLMTTVTMVLAMLPLALPLGTGSADRMPMALVLIGGMSLSTVLTLLVLPAVYTYLWGIRQWFGNRITRQKPRPFAPHHEWKE